MFEKCWEKERSCAGKIERKTSLKHRPCGIQHFHFLEEVSVKANVYVENKYLIGMNLQGGNRLKTFYIQYDIEPGMLSTDENERRYD